MKRKIKNKPNAIFTADWHLREDVPECRIDDFWITQWNKVAFISELQEQHDCPVIHAGDLFNHWKPSPFLLSETIKYLPARFYTIHGNHDLPQHNLDLVHKCGIFTLMRAGKLAVLAQGHWGVDPENWKRFESTSNFIGLPKEVLVYHIMTYQGKDPWPGCTDPKAVKLLRKYPEYDLIVTGHNHKSFVEEYDGRLLVNPGSLTRQEADKAEHKPCVYLWYAENNTVERVDLPIEKGVVSREHIDKKENRDNRIDAFVSSLNSEWTGAVSFEKNVEKMLRKNKVKTSVKQIVYKALDL